VAAARTTDDAWKGGRVLAELFAQTGGGAAVETLRAELAAMRDVVDGVPSMLAYWDREQRCRFANQAYETWFGVAPEALLGKTLEELLGPIYPLNLPYIEGALGGEQQAFERLIPDPHGGPPRYSQANYIPHVVDGVVRGFVVQVADISRHKQLEDQLHEANEELKRVNAELRSALDNVKLLSGLLPICAWCKSIRTDEGYYQQAESFISSHTDATFTHVICPDCAERLRESERASPTED